MPLDLHENVAYYSVMTAEDVKRIRNLTGLNKTRFALLIGAGYTTVNAWEAGRSRPQPVYERILRQLESQYKQPSE